MKNRRQEYRLVILDYREIKPVMTSSEIKGFLWNREGQINYGRSVKKGPHSQTLVSIDEITSAHFINSYGVHDQVKDRVSDRSLVYAHDKLIGKTSIGQQTIEIARFIVERGLAKL